MCGICGVVQVGGEPRQTVEPWVLDRMTDAMVHRGPDDRGVYQGDGVALGVRRLSIVDVEGGHQPLANEDASVWAMQNGELYNHLEVREELIQDGHVFHTRCDTEIIPHFYERHGVAFTEQLRGKFGLVVWDATRRRAVIARDRLGVKRVYFARAGDVLVFASELKSLLASGLVEDALDYEAIDTYLTFGFFPGPRTPLAGGQKLEPGHRLVVDTEGVHIEPYWTYPRPAPVLRSAEEHAAGLICGLESSRWQMPTSTSSSSSGTWMSRWPTFPPWVSSRFPSSRSITVALSRQGADELLGGYAKRKAAAIAGSWSRVPRPIRKAGESLALRGPQRIRRAARTLAAPGSVDRLLAMSGRLDQPLRRRLLTGPLAGLDGDAARRAVLARLDGVRDEPLPTTLFIDAQLALVDDMLHYFDRASMAHSLEVRVPFLDHFVEYCATIPSGLMVRRLSTKYVLKRAARGLIPDAIIDKPKIGFFAASVDRWFREQTRGAIATYLLRPDLRSAEFLDGNAVAELVRAHGSGADGSNGRLLLSILMLEIWLSSYLPRARSAADAARPLASVA